MKYLFVFAHPDDETVACAGTIKLLREAGHSVTLISATPGDAGEVSASASAELKRSGSVGALRARELEKVARHLSISEYRILEYADGSITNQDVWGRLQQDVVDIIDEIQPDVIITFDHTGWYYHLDHVGVSIATTLAYQSSTHRAKALLFSHYQPGGSRWKYVFRPAPATHYVEVGAIEHKKAALLLHKSQDLSRPLAFLDESEGRIELFELAFADQRGTKLFAKHDIFKPLKPSKKITPCR